MAIKFLPSKMRKLFTIYFLFITLFSFFGCSEKVEVSNIIEKQPCIFPDYNGVTLPYNIAPTNFAIEEEGEKYTVEIGKIGNDAIIVCNSSEPIVKIPEKKWRKLLEQSKGGNIYFRVYVQKNNSWIKYDDIVNTISTEAIDPYLVYRLIYPGYELWKEMGIYQRNLTNFKEEVIVENRSLKHGCVNCHTFAKNSPNTMLLHIRGEAGGTVIVRNNCTIKTDMKVENMDSRDRKSTRLNSSH